MAVAQFRHGRVDGVGGHGADFGFHYGRFGRGEGVGVVGGGAEGGGEDGDAEDFRGFFLCEDGGGEVGEVDCAGVVYGLEVVGGVEVAR